MDKKEILKGGFRLAKKEFEKNKKGGFTVYYNEKSKKYTVRSLKSKSVPKSSTAIYKVTVDGYYQQLLF